MTQSAVLVHVHHVVHRWRGRVDLVAPFQFGFGRLLLDLPERAPHRVRLRLTGNQGRAHEGVVGAVDIEIEPEVEEVIMIGRDQIRRNQGAVLGVLRRRFIIHRGAGNTFDRIKPGRANHDVDAAVLIEHVVDQVVVIAHFRGAANHQLRGRSTFGRRRLGFALRKDLIVAPGGVADVAFEHADGVGNFERAAIILMHDGWQVGSIVGAIDAGAQRRHEQAKAVFATVHVSAPVPAFTRVHVRDEYFGQVRLIKHRAPLVLVLDLHV